MTSDSETGRFNAAALIEESTIAGIRHKLSETLGKKVALLAAVTGLAAAIVGVSGKPPWDFGVWEISAFLVFIAGGILPGLYSVFARTTEEEGRLAKDSRLYWLWVKIACISIACAMLLLGGGAIFAEGDGNEQGKVKDTTTEIVKA